MAIRIVKEAGGRDFPTLEGALADLPATFTEDESIQLIGTVNLGTSTRVINNDTNGFALNIEPFPGDGTDPDQNWTNIFDPVGFALREGIAGGARLAMPTASDAGWDCFEVYSANVRVRRLMLDMFGSVVGASSCVCEIRGDGFLFEKNILHLNNAGRFPFFVMFRMNGDGVSGMTANCYNNLFYFSSTFLDRQVFRCNGHAGNVLNVNSNKIIVPSDIAWPDTGNNDRVFRVDNDATINAINNAIFGFPDIIDSSSVGTITGDFNHSDVAEANLPGGAGINNVGGITFGRFAPFKDADSGSFDAYPIDASALQNSGGTALAEDMLGTARPQGAQDDAGAIELPEAPASPSGAGDQNLPKLVLAAQGAEAITGIAALSLPRPVQAAAVAHGAGVTAAAAQGLPRLSQSAAASETIAAAAAQPLPATRQSAQVTHGDAAIAAAALSLPRLVQAASVAEVVSVAAAQALPMLKQGSVAIAGGSIVFAPPPFVSIAVLVQPTIIGGTPYATAAQGLPRLAQAAQAAQSFDALAAHTLPTIGQAASASHGDGVGGGAAQVLPRPLQAASSAIRVGALAALVLPRPILAATADIRIDALSTLVLPSLRQAAAVMHGDAVVGAAALVLPRLAQAASSVIGIDVLSAMTLPRPRQSVLVDTVFYGSAAQVLPMLLQGPAFVPIAAAPVKLFEVYPSEWLFEA